MDLLTGCKRGGGEIEVFKRLVVNRTQSFHGGSAVCLNRDSRYPSQKRVLDAGYGAEFREAVDEIGLVQRDLELAGVEAGFCWVVLAVGVPRFLESGSLNNSSYRVVVAVTRSNSARAEL